MICKWILLVCAGLGLLIWEPLAAAPALRIALHSETGPTSWPQIDQQQDKKNLPIVSIDQHWPLDLSDILFPQAGIPLLLRLHFADSSQIIDDQDLDRLAGLLVTHPDISHLAIAALATPEDYIRLAYLIKKVSTQAHGANPDIQIAIELSGELDEPSWLDLAGSLAVDPDVAPYFDAFLYHLLSDRSREMIMEKAPRIVFWKWCSVDSKTPGTILETKEILTRIVADQDFEKQGTVLLLVTTDNIRERFPSFSRFCACLENEIYRDVENIMVNADDGSSYPLPIFVRKNDFSQLVFLDTAGSKNLKLSLEKGEYQDARIENLITGERFILKIRKHAKALLINRQSAFLAIELIPRLDDFAASNTQVDVQGRYALTAEEIVARVRAWDAVQKNKLRSYLATMTVSLRLHVANMNETFDLTTRGPIFAERGKPYDWVWKEFYVNGVKWKGQVAPKIPLLQPEKVSILPLAIDLAEGYQYVLAGETVFKGHRVYMIDFKPRKKFEMESRYRGRMYVDAVIFARLYEHAIQLNLKGEVLSNNETQYIEAVPGADDVWLPMTIKGEQVFSIGGRVTNIERLVTLTAVVINPPDIESRRAEAFSSQMQIVRDTDQGLRYLVKDKKSDQRVVEWKVKKSQLAGVLGTFFDSSLSFPLPIAGISYINFNLGGKGKQVNILFGGALLTATYSDPAFLGTRVSLGADLFAIAFPSNNSVYRDGVPIKEEKIRNLPAWLQINFGLPLNPFLKLTSSFFCNYNRYSRSADTNAGLVLPESGLTFGANARLTFDSNGYNLSLLGTYFHRKRWDFWGMSGNDDYNPDQNSYIRWRLLFGKDFFFSRFRRLHFGAGYFDGARLDRFSSYEFGFFSEMKLHGFKTGAVRAERALTFNVSYGYSIGEAFRLEAYYDSALVTNRDSGYANTYFSGAGISGTTTIPGLNTIVRFDFGLPVISNNARGFAIYLVFLKMF